MLLPEDQGDKYALVHHYSEVGEYAVGEYLIGEYNNLESGFYFIDKNGDESMKGKSFPIALPFNESIGFAKVKQNESDNFYSLLDTLGNVYPLATKLEHLKDTITALDLSNNGIVELPSSLYQNIHLKILLLCDNKITTLNSDIKAMSNLILLNLKGNIISREEQEAIKKLLPNCEIQF